MGQCTCHPEIESRFLCMKHNVYLCEDCLTCRDPKLYCKFRSSCPIWFMDKQKGGAGLDAKPAVEKESVIVTLQPDGQQIEAQSGQTLLEAFQSADVYLNASCNGRGSCGKCKLVLEVGQVKSEPTALLSPDEKQRGYILACQSELTQDVTVRIPSEALAQKLKAAGMGEAATARLQGRVPVIDPMFKDIPLELPSPSLTDAASDLDRLHRGLKQTGCDTERLHVGVDVLRQMSRVVREHNWQVTASVIRRKCANEILAVKPGNGEAPALGLAIDVGTTSVVVYLVDMADGRILAADSGHNRQAACGDDVINRIVCAEKDGVRKLSRMALATINNLIGKVLDAAQGRAEQITNVVISGNTTMTHLLLEIEPRYIRREPYIPTASEFPIFKAGEIGLKTNPLAAVFVMPGPASYVGGDIVSGVLATGFHRESPLTLFIDVGTNGEIVLGNDEWLMTAACSAGPAFEGGGVRWGMRAEEGAIEKVSIDPETLAPVWETVGHQPPRGICGSGMIDLISEMLKCGIINAQGKFTLPDTHSRLRLVNEEKCYLIAPAAESALGEDLTFSETDIRSLILAKGAVFAGFRVLLEEVGLDFDSVERIYITGGFGQYLNIDRAVSIGLLPDINRSKFTYHGNSSIAGAYLALLSGDYRQEARRISNTMTYVDFSSNNRYMDEFTSALFLPHTNMEMFPSSIM